MRKRQLVIVLLLVSMVGAVAVNKGAAGVPQDLQALTTVVQNGFTALQNTLSGIQNGFTAVQNALSGIQDSLNNLSAAGHSNVRFTPTVSVFSPDGILCRVVNVSASTQTVSVGLIDELGAVLSAHTINNLPPGHAGSVGATTVTAEAYCKFPVVGGSRTDIRGSLAIFHGNDSDKLSVPAE